ncbi:MAG: type II toxin-antitoxin system death-on-curing family toxin [Burkholderiales bacterium]
MVEPIWVLDEVVPAIHQRQLAEHGGNEGIRDAGLLASALSRPKHQFAYGGDAVSIFSLAAAYAFGLARNHPFLDGNKRTAFVVSLLFLHINGYKLVVSQEEKYQTYLSLAAGTLEETALADWIARYSVPIEPEHP